MKNWTIKEATEVIKAGTDIEAIKEIAKHFPIFFMHAVRNDLIGVASGMGEKFTLRRLEFTDADTDTDTDADVDDDGDTGTDGVEGNLNEMSTKDLMKLCNKKGIKVPHYGKNKQFYLDALTGNNNDDEDGDSDDDEGVEENKYAGKTAMELYKIAKEKGLKPEPKQKSAVYLAMIEKAEAKEQEPAEDWGEEEEAAEKTKSKDKSKSKSNAPTTSKPTNAKTKANDKGTKKAAPAAPAATDDEDWDI